MQQQNHEVSNQPFKSSQTEETSNYTIHSHEHELKQGNANKDLEVDCTQSASVDDCNSNDKVVNVNNHGQPYSTRIYNENVELGAIESVVVDPSRPKNKRSNVRRSKRLKNTASYAEFEHVLSDDETIGESRIVF